MQHRHLEGNVNLYSAIAVTGSPFARLADDANWTITGNSLASKTYHSRESFLSEVIRPFNARMSVGPKADDPEHLWRGRSMPQVRHVMAAVM
jgi:hypothetical protein